MKKIINGSILSLIFVLFFQMLGIVANANEKEDAYKAFYEFIVEERHGKIKDTDFYKMPLLYKENLPYVNKILYSYLMDVTGDGKEELIIKEEVGDIEWIRIFQYTENGLKRIGQNGTWMREIKNERGEISYSSYEPEGYIGDILSSWQFPNISDGCLHYCIGNNGNIYLADEEFTDEKWSEGKFSFYKFNGDKMKKVITFESSFVNNRFYGIKLSNGSYLYKIDGENVNEEEYFNSLRKYISGGVIKLVNSDYENTLTHIKSYIPEYVNRYHNPSDWAKETVEKAIDAKIVPSELQKKYTTAIKREEFCEIATNMYEKHFGNLPYGKVTFNDTTNIAVQKMAQLGVVTGVEEGVFDPNGTLTREMAATILARLAGKMGIPLSSFGEGFEDEENISSWARENVQKVKNAGIMSDVGENKFSPKAEYTREQSMMTVFRLKDCFIPIEKIGIDKEITIWMEDGVEKCPEYTLYPSNATRTKESWKSDNITICSVDENTGELTPKAPGTATISVTFDSNNVKCSYVVNVCEKEASKKPIFKTLTIPFKTEAIDLSGLTDKEVQGIISLENIEFLCEYNEKYKDYDVKLKTNAVMESEESVFNIFFIGFRIIDSETNEVVKDSEFVTRFNMGFASEIKIDEKIIDSSYSMDRGIIQDYHRYEIEFYNKYARNKKGL